MISHKGTVFGGALIIAGTAIGGGMLGLPVLLAQGGFIPSIVIYLATWLFMTCTALLFVEIFLWSPQKINIVSMAKMTLGMPGQIIAWLIYIFLFYSLGVAYISGGGGFVNHLLNLEATPWLGPLIFTLVFAPFVMLGAWAVDRINWIFMVGLFVSLALFIVLGVFHIDLDLLAHMSWSDALIATPVVFTSFGFQGTVPSLTSYLERDYKRTRLAIWIGSTLPFVVYIIWQALILGIIPLHGLEQAKAAGDSAVQPLKEFLRVPWVYRLGNFFAFFAIVTSFLGVTLGLSDFLADGLKVQKKGLGRLGLGLLIFIPPLIVALSYPYIFLIALQYAGGFGCALILGLMPILMTISGRYFLKKEGARVLGGGLPLLVILLLFIVYELTVMIVKQCFA